MQLASEKPGRLFNPSSLPGLTRQSIFRKMAARVGPVHGNRIRQPRNFLMNQSKPHRTATFLALA
ncbi:MAG: hypothetical protein Q8K85_04930, partial [Hyphomicrobium sp.]|nr:hypothetical protein [Hyphomicrobium sp.]